MDKLYNWRARRAGGRITITHSTGKVVGVDVIQPDVVDGADARRAVVAIDKNGKKYELA